MKQPGYSPEELIHCLQHDTCTPEQLKLIKQWIAEPDMGQLPPGITPGLLQQLKDRMHASVMRTVKAPVASIPNRHHIWRIAAAAAVIILTGTLVLRWYFSSSAMWTGNKKMAAVTVIDNNQQAVRKITLPDGTHVWLNIHSRLQFDPAQYNTANRLVHLSGEGFFDVAHDAAKPFIVSTGSLQTKVLGTAFNIEAYNQESEIRIALVRGRVSLSDETDHKTAVLEPHQTLRYTKRTKTWQVTPTLSDNIEKWTTGHLVFNDVPVQDALQRIAARYRIDIVFDSTLVQNQRITATLLSNAWQSTLRNVLFVHGLTYKTSGNQIMIMKNQ